MKSCKEIVDQFNQNRETMKLNGFDPGDGHAHGGTGIFRMSGTYVAAIWACDEGWDHVSVSLRNRTPKYQEMKFMKRFFFREDEWVVEYHPPALDYISVNDNVLHLWRPHDVVIPTPPKFMV